MTRGVPWAITFQPFRLLRGLYDIFALVLSKIGMNVVTCRRRLRLVIFFSLLKTDDNFIHQTMSKSNFNNTLCKDVDFSKVPFD